MSITLEGFDKFTQQGRSFSPKISIRKRGQIGFNNGAVKRFKLNEFNYAVMYISKDRTKIAFKFTSDDEEGSVKIAKRSNNFFVSGKSFLDYYDIPYDESKTYSAEWSEEQSIAIIDISQQQEDASE